MIIDLIEVLNKEEDPDPEEITLDPDLRGPKCNGSFGSASGTLVERYNKSFLAKKIGEKLILNPLGIKKSSVTILLRALFFCYIL
jgi:hypothetical protein